ncbi:MAG: TetR/AcrR family transcriptional regulator [Acidimicrobiia bacterium]
MRTATGPENVDGRRVRRDRNRDAVVDALLTLYRAGNLEPSSAEIAERAGLSPRSLFRYFDDVDDLCEAAIARQEERIRPLAVIGAAPSDPFETRISALVAQRIAMFDAMGQVGAVARLKAPFLPIIAAELTQMRGFFRNQLKQLFANELATLPTARAAAVLAALDVLTSFESYQLLRTDQSLSQAECSSILVDTLAALLAAPSVTDREVDR